MRKKLAKVGGGSFSSRGNVISQATRKIIFDIKAHTKHVKLPKKIFLRPITKKGGVSARNRAETSLRQCAKEGATITAGELAQSAGVTPQTAKQWLACFEKQTRIKIRRYHAKENLRK